jgi:signal transduction histidine kinase
MFRRNASEMRVLILAPIGRDVRLLAATLEEIDVDAKPAADPGTLLGLLQEGAGSAIVAEEALTTLDTDALTAWLGSQPSWSDMPVIILTCGGRPTAASQRRASVLSAIGNVTFIERPVRPETVQSAVRTALRARIRQYEIRSRQEALLRANADLEQFAHSASHDLREPLRGIGIYSELLERNYGEALQGQGSEFLGLIRSSAMRMEMLLGDLMAYAQASNIPEETIQPVRARDPLNVALENLAAAIRESGAHISIADLPAVRMRESHLAQIFQNLIGNAIKYRGEEPLHVRLDVRREPTAWRFSVEDNGIGIPREYKETVFGLFKRLHTNEQYDGTGMGLAICRRIVERYRGRIWVESEPGCGSNFLFTVPA